MTSEQKYNCILCKDIFDSKDELQIHFRKHGDPNFNQKSRTRPPNSESCGEKSSHKSEMVGCDVCSEVFTTISKAITHKHKVHPDHDAKYFCPWCGKLFTMKHLYNKHIQSNHDGASGPDDKTFHCDICDVDFYVPSAVAYHNKFFHRQDTDYPDIGQSKKFKLINQEVMPIFYCAFCGEEYDNKINLHKHMADDHGDENQSPDEVLRCPLCEAVFYHLDAYEVHITFHMPDDLYSTKNETYSDLVEFSLESLPPVVEKVENLETQENDAESTINSLEIDKFLEIAMGKSQDDTPVKSKKHKKHKKSKKSAITLDEFLNMNKDVFGEGLDFQGIEEVPTRVVTKRLKGNKKSTIANTKAVTPVEIEKLKQQGIVIKKKVNDNPVQGIKVLKGVPTWSAKNTSKGKINPNPEINTSNEVLSKLMSQSNNAIKIVTKNSQNIQPDTNKTLNIEVTTNQVHPADNSKPVPEKISQSESDEENNSRNEKEFLSTNTEVNNSVKVLSHSIDSTTPKLGMPVSIAHCHKNTTPLDEHIDEEIDNDNLKSDTLVVSANPENAIISLNTLQNKGHIVIKRNSNNEGTNKVPLNSTEQPEIRDSDKEESDVDCERINNEAFHDKSRNMDDTNKSHVSNCPNNSLSVLQHLGHLVVKPINSTKIISKLTYKNMPGENSCEEDSPGEQNIIKDPKIPIPMPPPATQTCIIPGQQINNLEKGTAIDALKTLSKNITIKSLLQPGNDNTDKNQSDDDNDMHHEIDQETVGNSVTEFNERENITTKNVCKAKETKNIKLSSNLKKTNINSPTPKTILPNSDECIQNKNADILKRLTNITSKPLNFPKVDQVNQPAIIKRKIIPQQTPNEIETYNIDDSDDDIENDEISKLSEVQNAVKPVIALKNISKTIAVKTVNQQPEYRNINVGNTQSDDDHNPHTDDSEDETINTNTEKILYPSVKHCGQKFSNRNIAIKNAFKTLGKNITIKSRNSSPSISMKSQDHSSQDSNIDVNEASDPDSNPEKIKITEIDNHLSDDEHNPDSQHATNAIVQSPDDSCSDDNAELEDFENEIKSNTVNKPPENSSSKNPLLLNTLKNLSKNITIKSLNDPTEKGQFKYVGPKLPSNIKSQLTAQEFKKPAIEGRELALLNKNPNPRNVAKVQHSNLPVNQKMSAMTSSNQVNTVNKEVTVKTFQTQTKTVIQEITTTVTKTIKTINQSMKQEIRNSSQSNLPRMPQKIQGMRPNQKNLQGVVVRHASPPIGTKIGNAVPQIRPPSAAIRPPKQMAPVRAGFNSTRPNTPRMAVTKNSNPSPSLPTQKQVAGKTLKISPKAMAAMTLPKVKRPSSDDMTGPFSCFKKPKESLIPVSEVPNFSGETIAQYASTSHTSNTNVSTTTKVVKGTAVVTSSQMKSEKIASAKQISRVGNNSGITIVKTSQAQQMQTQEKTETNSMKQTTLAAIEKLQKQGLLVKKPRLDTNDDSDHSDPGDDENTGYNSSDEEMNV